MRPFGGKKYPRIIARACLSKEILFNSKLTLFILLLYKALSGCLADPMIGFCNVTYFIAGGQNCQRTMMSNLKHKSNADCRYLFLFIFQNADKEVKINDLITSNFIMLG